MNVRLFALAAALLTILLAAMWIAPSVIDVIERDRCLDAGGAWRDGRCEH
ncbi:hypothetical protein [Methylopila turkensis]|nr:hypothetical protein [Methylopila turkensis]